MHWHAVLEPCELCDENLCCTGMILITYNNRQESKSRKARLSTVATSKLESKKQLFASGKNFTTSFLSLFKAPKVVRKLVEGRGYTKSQMQKPVQSLYESRHMMRRSTSQTSTWTTIVARSRKLFSKKTLEAAWGMKGWMEVTVAAKCPPRYLPKSVRRWSGSSMRNKKRRRRV